MSITLIVLWHKNFRTALSRTAPWLTLNKKHHTNHSTQLLDLVLCILELLTCSCSYRGRKFFGIMGIICTEWDKSSADSLHEPMLRVPAEDNICDSSMYYLFSIVLMIIMIIIVFIIITFMFENNIPDVHCEVLAVVESPCGAASLLPCSL